MRYEAGQGMGNPRLLVVLHTAQTLIFTFVKRQPFSIPTIAQSNLGISFDFISNLGRLITLSEIAKSQ
jgi:hypothetical protein